MKKRLLTILFTFSMGPAFNHATELVYIPNNPSFGGSPLNGNILLNSAQAQNKLKDPGSQSARSDSSSLDRFTSSLESRLLNQLIGDIGAGNTGTLVTQDFIVDVIDDNGSLSIVITDLITQEVSKIEVSGLNPNN